MFTPMATKMSTQHAPSNGGVSNFAAAPDYHHFIGDDLAAAEEPCRESMSSEHLDSRLDRRA
jgi:hypothetical protein